MVPIVPQKVDRQHPADMTPQMAWKSLHFTFLVRTTTNSISIVGEKVIAQDVLSFLKWKSLQFTFLPSMYPANEGSRGQHLGVGGLPGFAFGLGHVFERLLLLNLARLAITLLPVAPAHSTATTDHYMHLSSHLAALAR